MSEMKQKHIIICSKMQVLCKQQFSMRHLMEMNRTKNNSTDVIINFRRRMINNDFNDDKLFIRISLSMTGLTYIMHCTTQIRFDSIYGHDVDQCQCQSVMNMNRTRQTTHTQFKTFYQFGR